MGTAARSTAEIVPFPARAAILLDDRGGDRALRVSWHQGGAERGGLVVISLWRGNRCVGTCRVAAADVPDLVDTLVRGLAAVGTDD